MTEVEPGTFQATLSAGQFLFAYPLFREETGHNFFGFMNLYVGERRTQRIRLVANVKDGAMPDVDVTVLDPACR